MALLFRGLQIVVLTAWRLAPAVIGAAAVLVFQGRNAAMQYFSRRLTTLVQRLGPAFIKGGQILSMRKDILPLALCQELSLLHDSVAPLAESTARHALAEAYGDEIDSIFARFDYHPRASGSIACVYWAQLADGREVAVKLQRPKIARVMATDLTLALRMGRLMGWLPIFRGIPVDEMLRFVCEAIYAQLDFRREAMSLVRLRENLSQAPRVWVPRIEVEACRDKSIVMEYISELDAKLTDKGSTAAKREFAERTLIAVYRMLFIDGFVHCDLHPGNLYFRRRGQIVVLDAGFSVQLSERLRRLFAEFFMNMSLGHGRRCAEIVVESTTGVGPQANIPDFTKHMADLVQRNSGAPAREFSLIGFSLEMFQLQRKYGLFAATELVFPLLCLLVIEGAVRELDPDIDFQMVARSVITQGVFGLRDSHWASGNTTTEAQAAGECGAC